MRISRIFQRRRDVADADIAAREEIARSLRNEAEALELVEEARSLRERLLLHRRENHFGARLAAAYRETR